MSIFVLLMSGFYLTMGLTLMSLHLGAFQDTGNSIDQNQARYIAQSAVQEARNFASHIDGTWSGTSTEATFAPGGKTLGTYKYTITKSGNIYDITGYSYIPNSTAVKKISDSYGIKMRNPNPQIIFSDGFETNDLSQWTGGQSNDTNVAWQASNTAPKNGTYHALAYRTSSTGSNKVARLITPTFNLEGYDQVVIRFVYKRVLGTPDSIQIYRDNGSGFTSVFNKTSLSSGAFPRPAERVTLTSGLTATTRFRVDVKLDANESLALDDFEIASPYAVYNSTVD